MRKSCLGILLVLFVLTLSTNGWAEQCIKKDIVDTAVGQVRLIPWPKH